MSLRILSVVFLGACLAASPPAPAQATAESLRLSVGIEYLPAFNQNQETWDLYVYLDGDLLAWVPRGGQFTPSPEVRFERLVSPGPHVVRLATEKHERRSKGKWRHQARIAPAEIFFNLSKEGDAELSLRLAEKEGLFDAGKAPLTVRVTQAGRVLQNIEQTGRSPAKWPSLCEEVEANLDPTDKKIPRKVRSELEHCVRWESLWRSLDKPILSRDGARDLLERYEFEPRSYKRLRGGSGGLLDGV